MTVLKPAKFCRIKGFTLVEVVIVMLLVGVILSIAVPRFLDLKQQALRGTLKAIEGTLHSTTMIYQPLAAIKSVKTGNLLINGANIQFNSGFPDGHWNNAFRYILDISTNSGYTNGNARCKQFRLCGVGMRSFIPTTLQARQEAVGSLSGLKDMQLVNSALSTTTTAMMAVIL